MRQACKACPGCRRSLRCGGGPCGKRSLTHLRNRHLTKLFSSLVVSRRQAVAHSPVGEPLMPVHSASFVTDDAQLEDARIRFGAAVRWVLLTVPRRRVWANAALTALDPDPIEPVEPVRSKAAIALTQPTMFRGSFDAAITWSETPVHTMPITEYNNSVSSGGKRSPTHLS